MAFFIKRNDTSPAIQAVLKDGSDNVVNLTGTTVNFHMRKIGATTAKVDGSANIYDDTGGHIYYTLKKG